jgi:hypothetical protein
LSIARERARLLFTGQGRFVGHEEQDSMRVRIKLGGSPYQGGPIA